MRSLAIAAPAPRSLTVDEGKNLNRHVHKCISSCLNIVEPTMKSRGDVPGEAAKERGAVPGADLGIARREAQDAIGSKVVLNLPGVLFC